MPKIFGISYRGLTDRGRKYIEMSPGATLSRYASDVRLHTWAKQKET